MKIIKLLITILTVLSISLLSACGNNPISSTDYTGKWVAIDSQGNTSKLTIQKQGERFLVTHKDFHFSTSVNLNSRTIDFPIFLDLMQENLIENQPVQIKDNILELDEGRAGKGTLIYKDGKFTGKPSSAYSESLTFEKYNPKDSKTIYEKAKEQFEKYMSTKKPAQNPQLFKYMVKEEKIKNINE